MIASLQSPRDGSLISDGPALADMMAKHQASISRSRPEHPAAAAAVLLAVRQKAQQIPSELAAAAGSPIITEQAVRRGLRHVAPGKAAGPDRIPMEIWRWYKDQLAPILSKIYTAIGHLGRVPQGALNGEIHPFHKAGNRADMSNYRPITLLNTDYRLLAKILASRLGPLLGHAIGPSQTAFLPGRQIGDNILLRQLLPSALKLNARYHSDCPSSAAMVFIDFAKAYDTVNRCFLYTVMEAVGVGEGFIKWATTLLTETKTTTAVNGYISPLYEYQIGVRQGCPLAPILYLFIAWALWCWLDQCPVVGVQISPNIEIKGDQFADDTHVLLKSHSTMHISQFLRHMALFAAATGQ